MPYSTSSPPSTKGTVAGVVTDKDTGRPIQAGHVQTVIQGPVTDTITVATDSQGRYTMSDLDQGSYTLKASALTGYADSSQPATVEGGKITTLDFTLKKIFSTSETADKEYTTSLNIPSTESLWLVLGKPILGNVAVSDSPSKATFNSISSGTVTILTFVFEPSFAVYRTSVDVS